MEYIQIKVIMVVIEVSLEWFSRKIIWILHLQWSEIPFIDKEKKG
jgi:hypothetical protein